MSTAIKLDKIDRAILDVLQTKADSSVGEISEQVGLTHTPCWRRVKRLTDSGVILSKAALLDPSKVGFRVIVFAQVDVRMVDENTLSDFESAVMKIDEVLECYSVAGDKDFMLRIVAESIEAYERLLKKKLIHLPGVSSIDSIVALSTVKVSTRLPLHKLEKHA